MPFNAIYETLLTVTRTHKNIKHVAIFCRNLFKRAFKYDRENIYISLYLSYFHSKILESSINFLSAASVLADVSLARGCLLCFDWSDPLDASRSV